VQLILASSSPYRRALLQRLRIPFSVAAPEVDESPRAGETPQALVTRLAEAKARAVAERREAAPALIIGSDQVAALEDRMLGKPGSEARAREQLAACSGRRVVFHTGLAVLATPQDRCHRHVEPFAVRFRALDDAAIARYVALERPIDSSGSLRAEGLGIALLEALEGRDPNSLLGLPLIALTELLAKEGCDVLAMPRSPRQR